jgi:membrane-associated protease RseP (regulator of RpoE activity)
VAAADSGITTVDVSSSPDAVDVYVDGQFVGNSPATLKLKSGKHIVSAKMNGYADWERELTVSGGTVNLNAKLVSGPSSPLTASASKAPFDADTKGMGWIGINTNDDGAGNVVIARIAPNSSAARAGLQIGDIIKQLNGVPVGSGERFYVAIARCHPGTEILLSYTRGASRSETKLLVEKEF